MVPNETDQKLIMEVENMVSLYLQLPDADQTKRGGYFCVMKEENGQVMFVQQIGDVADAPDTEFGTKATKYCQLAIEKASRVFKSELFSSWLTRNPDQGLWGGGVRITIEGSGLIFSFSGLPELADEAVVLSAAMRRGLLTEVDAATFAECSSNKIFFQMNPSCA